jgi:excisionase family DNA binding protein
MMQTVNERKFTAKEAADALGVTEACVRRWILTRRISSYRVGRLVRITESEIARILGEGFVPARPLRGRLT